MPNYREHPPAAVLRPYVDCYWTNHGARRATARILPDGCIDILFDFSAGRASARIVGAMTRPLLVEPGAFGAVTAVRFLPGGATPFLGLPADALTDSQAALADAWRDRTLADRLAEANEAAERVRLLEDALLARRPAARAVDRRVSEVVRLLRTREGNLAEAARRVGITRQHLNRLFRSEVGYGPKQLQRVLRMQRLHALIRGSARPAWAEAALAAGYCDQSHMIREHKTLAGLTPAAFHLSNTLEAA